MLFNGAAKKKAVGLAQVLIDVVRNKLGVELTCTSLYYRRICHYDNKAGLASHSVDCTKMLSKLANNNNVLSAD